MSSKFITKEQFTEAISALETQFRQDRKNVDLIGQIFGTEEMTGSYDNSLLSKTIIGLLRNYFPVDENGHCDIEHYCYVMNFGKIGDEYESPEELFTRLHDANYPDFFKEGSVDNKIIDENAFIGSYLQSIQGKEPKTSAINDRAIRADNAYEMAMGEKTMDKTSGISIDEETQELMCDAVAKAMWRIRYDNEENFIMSDPVNSTLKHISGTIEKIRQATEKGPRENDLVAELARSAAFYIGILKMSIELTQKKPLRGGEEQDV